jgi:hypothetical protein
MMWGMHPKCTKKVHPRYSPRPPQVVLYPFAQKCGLVFYTSSLKVTPPLYLIGSKSFYLRKLKALDFFFVKRQSKWSTARKKNV